MKIFYRPSKQSFIICTLLNIAIVMIVVRFAPTFWHYKKPDIVVESFSMNDVFSYIKPNEYTQETCVIFDIDNTLAKTPGHLGSDHWFHWQVDQLEKKGLTRQEAISTILPLVLQLMHHIWMEPVEATTAQIVKELQDKGLMVIALTARSLDLTYRTIEQLNHIGITFTGTGPRRCPITYGDEKPALYIDGILFCGSYSKGEVIAHWFDQINYHPKKVIFIDDRMPNIQSVEQALAHKNYPFIGIRYGHLDTYIKTMTPEIIAQEYASFMAAFPESKSIASMPTY